MVSWVGLQSLYCMFKSQEKTWPELNARKAVGFRCDSSVHYSSHFWGREQGEIPLEFSTLFLAFRALG